MTIDTLFGTEEVTSKPRTIKFKTIKAVYETLVVREDITNYLKTGTRFTSPQQVSDTFQFLMKETKEMFITLHLDGKNRIICMDLVSIGSLNQSIVHPRSVFMTACLSSAAAIICVHQHPTGDPTPSSEDISITRRLKEAGEIMGINGAFCKSIFIILNVIFIYNTSLNCIYFNGILCYGFSCIKRTAPGGCQ